MSANRNLHKAKKAKNDEFYTRIEDIEREMVHYREHFRDKVVFCNCDDPESSMFWTFFFLQFSDPLGLRKLIATHYDPENPSYKLEYDGTGEPVRTPLEGNGDFRSPECLALLDEADIVVTNPPFSLFREYVATLEEHGKEFLILGNVNAITYKEIFPLIKDNKMWAGCAFNKTLEFIMPDSYELKGKAFVDEWGRKHGFVPACCWYTNLTHSKRNEEMFLWRKYDPETYPHYDNYDAIEVSQCRMIPCDWEGVMGVPITFLDVYNPDQFEIVGMAKRGAGNPALKSHVYTKEEYPNYSDLNATPTLWVNGKLKNTYPRILIRNRHPEPR